VGDHRAPGASEQPTYGRLDLCPSGAEPGCHAPEVAEVLVDVQQIPDDDHHTDDLEDPAEVLDLLRVHGWGG
jgi:hypothetical protein